MLVSEDYDKRVWGREGAHESEIRTVEDVILIDGTPE